MYALSHLQIFCRDLERMIRFWTKALHAEFICLKEFGGKPGAVVRCGGIDFCLKQEKEADEAQSCAAGVNHIGFFVNDIHKEAERLIGQFGCSLRQADEGKPFLFLRGPEGLIIELQLKQAD